MFLHRSLSIREYIHRRDAAVGTYVLTCSPIPLASELTAAAVILQVMITTGVNGSWCANEPWHIVLGASSTTLAMGPCDHRSNILDAADTCPSLRYARPKLYVLGRLDSAQVNRNTGLRPSRS